jgi:hypothetical protein
MRQFIPDIFGKMSQISWMGQASYANCTLFLRE